MPHAASDWTFDTLLPTPNETNHGPHESSEDEVLDPAPTGPTEEEACPVCLGEGYLIHVGGPGRYDAYQEAWMPSEDTLPCDACHGSGYADIDPRADPQPDWPTIHHGACPATREAMPTPSIAPDAHLDDPWEWDAN